jgi:hypothetical protein
MIEYLKKLLQGQNREIQKTKIIKLKPAVFINEPLV